MLTHGIAFNTLLLATGLAIIQIIKSGPHGFTYLADNWIPLLTSSLIMSTAQAIYLYAISFKGDRLLALGGNTGNLIHDVSSTLFS